MQQVKGNTYEILTHFLLKNKKNALVMWRHWMSKKFLFLDYLWETDTNRAIIQSLDPLKKKFSHKQILVTKKC